LDDAPVRLRPVTPSGAPALVLLTGQRFTETAWRRGPKGRYWQRHRAPL